jgi:hypothetical protein
MRDRIKGQDHCSGSWVFSRRRKGADSARFRAAQLKIKIGLIGNCDKQDPFWDMSQVA